MGISFVKVRAAIKNHAFGVFLFSLMTPIGVGVGMGLEYLVVGRDGVITTGVLGAFSAGSFLYISIVDILVDEFSSKSHALKYAKSLMCALGFALITVLVIFTDHEDH